MARRKTVPDGQYSLDDYQLKEVNVRLCLRDGNILYSTSPISEPEEAVSVMRDVMKELDREMFCAVNLDNKLRPLNYTVVSIGNLNSTIVSVQNVFKAAILSNASRIIALHNHPSGEIVPSREDYEVTARIALAGQLMQTPLLDHVIVGGMNGNLYSFRSEYPDLFKDDLDFDLARDMLSGQKPPKRKSRGAAAADQRPADPSERESALKTLADLKQAEQPPCESRETAGRPGKEAR